MKLPFFDNHFTRENGVYFQNSVVRPGVFEEKYFRLRLKEGRIHPDSVVAKLPATDSDHVYAREWNARRASLLLIANYLNRKSISTVLEIGCGNGWLSHRLASTIPANVTGLDCNEIELTQAARVFNKKNLSFVYGDIFSCPLRPGRIDTIILASSLQYFNDFSLITKRCLELLSATGELHIFDTPVYKDKIAAEAAAERSRRYFSDLGMEEMSNMYFHHLRENFETHNADLLFDPGSCASFFKRHLFRKQLPAFPWFRIRKGKK
jgi:SAM-dependent methyltransferase